MDLLKVELEHLLVESEIFLTLWIRFVQFKNNAVLAFQFLNYKFVMRIAE